MVLAAPHAFDAEDAHQPRDLIAADVIAGVAHRGRELVGTIETAVRPPAVQRDVRHVRVVPVGITDRARLVSPIGARGDRQFVLAEHPADRLDPEAVPMRVDVVDDHRSRRSSSA